MLRLRQGYPKSPATFGTYRMEHTLPYIPQGLSGVNQTKKRPETQIMEAEQNTCLSVLLGLTTSTALLQQFSLHPLNVLS